MDHSREVLKSHSEIYKVYGVLVQGETQYLGPCCSNVEQQEITIKRIRISNCVIGYRFIQGKALVPGALVNFSNIQPLSHTPPQTYPGRPG